MLRINKKKELKELAKKLGVRNDWHEPDDQDVDVKVSGYDFDNAGFDEQEMMVIIYQNNSPVAKINLATLLSFACDTNQGNKLCSKK